MTRFRAKTEQRGFTLIELLTALGIFLLVCGAAFTLLGSSQKHYQTESQVLSSFQEARLGLDQIVRDVDDAGYPPPAFAGIDPTKFASTPFTWIPGYPAGTSCAVGTGVGTQCTVPSGFDLIIETNPNPQDAFSQVQWIRYQLQGTTLMRGTANKVSPGDPDAATSVAGVLVPFVQNVVNTAAQPIFSYTCDTTITPPPTLPCPNATNADSQPGNIREVIVTLIVAAPVPDINTGQPRLVQLTGRGRRVNPNQ